MTPRRPFYSNRAAEISCGSLWLRQLLSGIKIACMVIRWMSHAIFGYTVNGKRRREAFTGDDYQYRQLDSYIFCLPYKITGF